MARVRGVEPNETSFLMPLVFKKVPKLLGKDLTPQGIQASVPRVFWASTIMELLFGQTAKVPMRLRSIAQLRTAARLGCPF